MSHGFWKITTKSNEKWQFINCLISLFYQARVGPHCLQQRSHPAHPVPSMTSYPCKRCTGMLFVCKLLFSVCSLRGTDLHACPSCCRPICRRHSISDRSWKILYNRKCFHLCFISWSVEWGKYRGLKDQFMLCLFLLPGQKVLINHKTIICSDLISYKVQEMGFFFSILWGWNS